MRRFVPILALAATACAGVVAPSTPAPDGVAACRPASAAVRWIGTAHAQDRAAQDAWCAAVGAPLLVTAPAVPARADSIAVLTWNVKVGGGDIRGLIRRLRAGELTGGAPVEHFVLLLQEAHRSGEVPAHVHELPAPRSIEARAPDGTRTSIDVLADELDLALAYVPSMRNGARAVGGAAEDRGNAILATLPLRDVVAIELPLVRQRRVAVSALISGVTTTGATWDLRVASVHLENRPARGLTGANGRAHQMQHLLDVLPAAPLAAIGGDLNTWLRGAGEPAARLALEHYPDTGEGPAAATYDGPAFFDRRLDYLFARVPGGRITGHTRLSDRYGSDHHPVIAWLHLPVQ